MHEVADEEQLFEISVDIHAGKAQTLVGTAVEMKDDESADDRCMKDNISVGSVASRHAHDRGIGIRSFGGHVPVRSRIDMSESEVCIDQDAGSLVECSVEKHDVGSFDTSNVRGSEASSSRRRRLPKHKRNKIPHELPFSTIATGPAAPAVRSPNDPIPTAVAPITPMFVIDLSKTKTATTTSTTISQ